MANNNNNTGWIVPVAIGAVILLAGKQILSALGITALTTPSINNLLHGPSSANPFSKTFGQDYNAANDNSDQIAALVSQTNASIQNKTFTDRPGLFSASGNINIDAGNIYNAFGTFSVDKNAIDTAFADLTSQYSVSVMAQILSVLMNIDLWTLLNNGNSIIPGSALGASYNIEPIVQHVQTLPVYPPAWNV